MLLSIDCSLTMQEPSFYAVLPSNASANVFQTNSQHTFKIKTPFSLPASDKWSVGLVEIQFPVMWRNMIDGYIMVKFEEKENPLKCDLFDGIYRSIEELLQEIYHALAAAQLQNDITFRYDKIRNRIILQIQNRASGFGIKFSQNIINMLGLSKQVDEYFNAGEYTMNKPPDIYEGFSALYIYSDVIQSRVVGDTMAPLLRVVPIERDPNAHSSSYNWIRFEHVQYLPINQSQSDTIEVNIRRDNGDVVPFESGKVVLTLHFKKDTA